MKFWYLFLSLISYCLALGLEGSTEGLFINPVENASTPTGFYHSGGISFYYYRGDALSRYVFFSIWAKNLIDWDVYKVGKFLSNTPNFSLFIKFYPNTLLSHLHICFYCHRQPPPQKKKNAMMIFISMAICLYNKFVMSNVHVSYV